MTAVDFHYNVHDRLAYACRLLRKAVRVGAKVAVSGPGEVLSRLDKQLWVFEPLDFTPHILVRPGHAPAPRLQDTPVWLVQDAHAVPHREVLVNLGDEPVEGFDAFARLIEIVSRDGEDRLAGRTRWKYYEQQGHKVNGHDKAREGAE